MQQKEGEVSTCISCCHFAPGGRGVSQTLTRFGPTPFSHADESSRGGGEMKPELCESQLDDVSKRVPIVRFLLEALEKAGCPIKRSFFEVEHCTQAVMGGFKPGGGVVLCHNNLSCRTDIENMLAHELVHAYDHCRCVFRGVEQEGFPGGRYKWARIAHQWCA